MIDLLPSYDQTNLAEAVRAFMSGHYGNAATSPDVMWDALFDKVSELDWAVLSLPPSSGGAGFSITDEFVVFVELGRWLAPLDLLCASLGVEVAVGAGEADLARDIQSGNLRLGLAESVDDKLNVVAAKTATLLLFRSDGGWGLLESPDLADAAQSVDPGLRFAVVDPVGLKVRARFADSENRVALRAGLLVVALLSGIAQASCDRSVSYAKQRFQFGRPIGTNQVVKHRCADMAVRAAAATAVSSHAAVLLEAGDRRAPAKLRSARIVATDAAIKNASADIRNHGAVGFTYEDRAHWYLRRGRLLGQVLNLPTQEMD